MEGATALALAGLAASAAGTGVSMSAQAAARDEANRKTQQELQRQRGFQQQGKQQFAASLGKSGSDVAQKQIDTGTQQHLAEYQKAQALPTAISQPTQLDQPSQNLHQQAESAYVGQQGQARAQLGGYSEWDLQQWIKNLRAQQQLGQVQNFARGSQNVLPYELEQAQHSQDTMQGIGTGLSALGALGGGVSGIWGAANAAKAAAAAAQAGQVASASEPFLAYYPSLVGSLGGVVNGMGMSGNRRPTYNNLGPSY